MANFTTIAKVRAVSDIDNENVSGRTPFTDTQVQDAMDYGNARILFELKDWEDFYPESLDAYVALVLDQAEVCYAASWLFEQKANQFMNLGTQGEAFAVGDLAIPRDDAAMKLWYTQYHILADRYFKMGFALVQMIMPPGTDAVKSTFYFEQCKSIQQVENEAIETEV